jgi:hypothetical protein
LGPAAPVRARIVVEVRIRCHEHAIVAQREGHDLVVGVPREPEQADVGGVVSGLGQQQRHGVLQRLVDE